MDELRTLPSAWDPEGCVPVPQKIKLDENLPKSIPLVKYNEITKVIDVNPEATQLLGSISKPFAILGICGPYRSGKSYFLSQLLGEDDFTVSHSMDPCTRGVWMSTSVLDLKDCMLIVLDTEGIGAVQASEASSRKEVMGYLIVVTLLCSCLIYNTKGTIEDSHLQQMSCFAELSQSVLISESHKQDNLHNLKEYFPNFLWLMRDCDLEFEDDNQQEISATKYVRTKVLVTNTLGDKPLSTRDRTVNSIVTVFPSIECLTVPSPGAGLANPKKQHLIDPDFFKGIEKAKNHIISNIQVKQCFNKSAHLTGPMLASLLKEYVDALNSPDAVPNLELSYWTAVDTTLRTIICDLANLYYKIMTELLECAPPLEEGEDISVLKRTHLALLEESLTGLVKESPNDISAKVEQGDYLFQIHKRIYIHVLRIFCCDLHRLIPDKVEADQAICDNIRARKTKLLEQLERLMVTTDECQVTGGHLHHFTIKNQEKSASFCKEQFDAIYKQQIYTDLSLESLKKAYYMKAVGPRKDIVFQQLISQVPTPPQNVRVSVPPSTSDEKITLKWDTASTHTDVVSHYNVEWYSEDGNIKRATVHRNEYKLEEKLKPITNYYFKVQGINSNNNRQGEFSEELKYLTGPGKPDTPDVPKIDPISDTKAKLTVNMLPESGQNGSPVTNIIVSRRSDTNSNLISQTFPINPQQGDVQILEIDIECTNNENHLWFQIQFENEAGKSEPSKKVELDAKNMIPGKVAIENIRITSKAREIQLFWEPPKTNSGAVRNYHLQYWNKGTNQEQIHSKIDKTLTDRSIELSPLHPNTEYVVQVCARNAKDESCGYTVLNVKTRADVPNRPQLPTIQIMSSDEAIMTFYRQSPEEENGSPVHSVIIESTTKTTEQNATNWELVKDYPIPPSQSDLANVPLQINLINLTENFVLSYRLRSVNSIGKSEPSQSVDLHPQNIIPGPPQNLEPSEVLSKSVTISWKAPTRNPFALKKYQIQYRANREATWTPRTTSKDTSFCTISDLRPDTDYHFVVQALNGNLISKDTCLQVKTPPSAPPNPKPPVVKSTGKEFTLKVHLPAIEESGREVTYLYINHYDIVTASKPFKEDRWEVKSDLTQRNNIYEQKTEINIDETHWISISIENEVGKSGESDWVGLSIGDVTPGIPDELTCKEESRHVELSWRVPKTNGNAVKHYEILLRKEDDSNWTLQENCSIRQKRTDNSLTYEARVDGLIPATIYQFGVQAVNNTTKNILVSNRAITNKITMKTAPPDKPHKPLSVEPLAGNPLCVQVQVPMLNKKQMNGSEVDTVIIDCTCGDEPKSLDFLLTKTQRTQTDVSLQVEIPNLTDPNINSYSFQIRMKNTAGVSEPSDVFSLSTSKIQPGPPKNIQIQDVTTHSIKVTWEKPDIHPVTVTHYIVRYTKTETQEQNEISIASKTYECIISDLQSNQPYDIQIFAAGTKNSIPSKEKAITKKIYPGAPSCIFVDKVGITNVKIRWRKPSVHPDEVLFYTAKIRPGDYFKKNKVAQNVVQKKRTRGLSTVFENLVPYTTYTVSVSVYNDNKKRSHESVAHVCFCTKMSIVAKRALQVITAPSLAGPLAVQFAQEPDKNMEASDDEFKSDPDLYPGAPEELSYRIVGPNEMKVKWNPPVYSLEELYYFKVKVLEKRSGHVIQELTSFGNSEIIKLQNSVDLTLTVISYNYYEKSSPDAVATLDILAKDIDREISVTEILSV